MRGLEQRLRLDASSRTGWLREEPDCFVCRSNVIYVLFGRSRNQSFLIQDLDFLMNKSYAPVTLAERWPINSNENALPAMPLFFIIP